MNFANVLRYWSRWQPDAVAISFEGRDVTWAGLDGSTSQIAQGLMAAGLSAGDRVGVLLMNCVEFVELVFACAKAGLIFVPLNVRLAPPELLFLVNNAGCSVVVTDAELAPRLDPIMDEIGARVVFDVGAATRPGMTSFSALRDAPAADPAQRTDARDTLFICYTSGTTGLAKGAMLSHESVCATGVSMVLPYKINATDRVHLPFPLAFTGGLMVMVSTVVAGARMILDRHFDAERSLALWQSEAVTAFHAVPVIYEQIAALPGFATADLSAMRIAGVGGAPVPASLVSTYLAKNISMTQSFGLTEGGGFEMLLPPADVARKIGSCGFPVMQLEARLVDESGGDVDLGEVGEIVIRGPQVMTGYWDNPEATRAALDAEGWLHTGDLGVLDDEGYYRVVDRRKDMIISGGLNVYPAEIERVLAALPGVTESAVIGVSDSRWSEVPAAVVVTKQDLSPEVVLEFCKQQLADYKIPRYVLISSDPLPRGMSGKVLKRELRTQYADRFAPQGSGQWGPA